MLTLINFLMLTLAGLWPRVAARAVLPAAAGEELGSDERSRLDTQGEGLLTVSQHLGHTALEITSDFYFQMEGEIYCCYERLSPVL